MKIIIADSFRPFASGQNSFSGEMRRELSRAGYITDTVLLPFSGQAGSCLDELFGFSLLNLTGVADLIICLSMPALFVRHPSKLFFSDALSWPMADEASETGSPEKIKQIADQSRTVTSNALNSVRKVFLSGRPDVDWLANHSTVAVDHAASWRSDFIKFLQPWIEGISNLK